MRAKVRKKSILILVLLVSSLFVFTSLNQTASASEEVKIMTYNIEESGADPDWKNVVKEENPDIAVFVETGDWDDNNNALLDQYCNEFNNYFTDLGEDPYYCTTTQDVPYDTSGEAVFTRYPIVNTTQIPIVTLDDGSTHDVSHDFFDVVVDFGDFNSHIISSHLKCCAGNPENEEKRDMQQEGIINYMDDLGDVPVMYMGDLNSYSPVDVEDPDLKPDKDDLGWGPMSMMIRPDDPTYGDHSSTVHKFTDVFRELNPNDPGYTYGHQAHNLDGRIDFITVNQYFPLDSFTSSTVGDTASADTGSDHYSVDATFTLDSSSGDTTPPSQVTGLTANAVSDSQIDLGWDANSESDLDHYNIYRNGSYLTQVSAGTTSYSDTGLPADTTYTYEVSAVDTSGNKGTKSDPASATTSSSSTSDTMYVSDVTVTNPRNRGPWRDIQISVNVVDSNGNPLSGVTVDVTLETPSTSLTATAETDSNGNVVFYFEKADNTSGTYTGKVTDLTKSGYTYDSASNVETSDSIQA